MAGTMAVRHLERAPTNRVVWIAHRSELVDQAMRKLAELGADMARVLVESVQSLVNYADVPPATLAIHDECHHYVADQWFAIHAMWPTAFRVGLTATPERGDGRGLGQAYDDLVVAARHQELIDAGHLVPCHAKRPPKPLKTKQIAQRPVDAYLEWAAGRQCVVFCEHVKAAKEHLEEFRAAGLAAALVTGQTPWAERCATIDAFRSGRGQILLNVNVLIEGFDAPETSCCIIAGPVGTPGGFIQRVGRALRPAPGKVDALLLDLRGVSWYHGAVEDEREYSLEGKGIRLKSETGPSFCVCGFPKPPGESTCPDCGRSPPPLAMPKVTHDPLEAQQKAAAVPESKKVDDLAYWLRMAHANDYKHGWVIHRYKAKYFAYPSSKIEAAAGMKARKR